MRSFFAVPGLPTYDVDVMPLQPYSQPSGPHVRQLKTLCLESRLQPSRSTFGSPDGLSSFIGRNVTFGTPHSHTPPKPTAMPLRLVPLSRNTLTSWLPSAF